MDGIWINLEYSTSTLTFFPMRSFLKCSLAANPRGSPPEFLFATLGALTFARYNL